MKIRGRKLFWILTWVMAVGCVFAGNGMAVCAEGTEEEEEIVPIEINASAFPDENFREYVSRQLDRDQDGLLSVKEIKGTTSINLNQYNSQNVSDLSGIEYFQWLNTFTYDGDTIEKLNLDKNQKLYTISCRGGSIKQLDVSNNRELRYISCESCSIDNLDISQNENLKELTCKNCSLKQLDVSKNEALEKLICNGNELQSLNLTNNKALRELSCGNNQLKKLDLSNNEVLQTVSCDSNLIESISFADKNCIHKLNCYNNKLKNIDTKKLSVVAHLQCDYNEIKQIDTSGNIHLETLGISSNKDIKFDVSKNTELVTLMCEACGIDKLDLSNNKKLVSLRCAKNDMEELYLSSIAELHYLYCSDNQLESLSISQDTLYILECQNNKLKKLSVAGCSTLDCSNNELTDFKIPIGAIKVDCSHNKIGFLNLYNRTKLVELNCSYNKLKELAIDSAYQLKILDCSNNSLAYLDTRNASGVNATGLSRLICSNNMISQLYANPNLWDINCNNNKIENFKAPEKIGYLYCSNNALVNLDVKNCTSLISVECSNNNLSNIEFENNKALETLQCNNNKLTSLNLEDAPALSSLNCSNNYLTSLNVEKNMKLQYLKCENNTYAVSQESQLDLSTLPGFQIEKASLWKNATVVKPILFVLDSEFPVTYTYNVGQNLKANFKISFDKVPRPIYDFAYSPNVYSQKLAKDSALYSMLAYDEYRVTSDGQYYTQEKGRQNCPILLLGQLKRDGFYNWSCFNYRDADPHNCSYTFATRNIKYNGVTKTQIIVCIRGTDSVEWEGNMELTGTDYNANYASTHYSFEKASNDIEASLYNYIATIKKKGVDTNQCVIWVTGHSRGGAVANLLSAKLTDSGSNSIGDVFGYTYATANATTKYKDKSYNNIFNHCFVDDFVPSVPFEKWGYGNYGITYVANADYAYQAGKKSAGEAYRQFKNGMDRYIGLGSSRKESSGADFNYKETSKMLVHVTSHWKNVTEYYEKRPEKNPEVSLYDYFHNDVAKLAQGDYSIVGKYGKDSFSYIPLLRVSMFFVNGQVFNKNINDTHQSYTYYLATRLGLFNSSNSAFLAASNTDWELSKSGQPQDVTEQEQRAIENSDSLSGNSMDDYPVSANSVSQNTVSKNYVPANENIYGESIPNGRAGTSEDGEKTILTGEEEKERLIQFAMLNENKSKLGWNLSDNSTWSGIEFDEEGYVISIAIPYKELTGILDVSGFSKLRLINCEGNGLTSLILDNCISLVQAECYYNVLQTLQVKNCENLQYLDCDGNELEELDLSTCMKLIELTCSNNQLTYLDLFLQSQLDVLFCQENRLTNIVLPETNSLSRINCEYNYLKDLTQFEALAQNDAVWVLYREQKVPEDAVYAASDLENLKRLANTDENLKKLGWNLEAPDTWDGITWRYVGGTYYVEDIQLANRNLTGNLQLSNMEQVQSITLAENSINGLEINQCARLECVNCMENEIEELSLTNCNSLWQIYGYYNYLKNENVEKIFEDFGTKENSIIELHSQYIKGTKEEFASREMKIILNLLNEKDNKGQFQLSEEEPGRWDYVKWEKQADNLYHITEIDFSGLWIGGTLDLTGFTALKYIDCDNTNLEEVILPDSLETITEQAFLDCKLLKKVTIPASVKTIEEYAFARCSNLAEVLFYSKNAVMDSNSFYKSTSIRSISCYQNTTEADFAYASQPTFSYWDENVENNKGNDKENHDESSKQPVTDKPLPGNKTNVSLLKKGDIRIKGSGKYKITKVGKGYGTVIYLKCTNKKIKNVTIPSTITIDKQKFKVTEIGEKAFYGCKKLKKVTIGKYIVRIRKSAFAKCPKLKTIKIQCLSLKSVGKNAFKGISKNATLSVPKSKQKKYTAIMRKKAVGLNKNAKIKTIGKKK
ncbi:MAG: leucine-rich repeat protein [Lachnospiraceae bacterium]|nr:leucine-rich repeat protein [Lachnospiraceae bacterium]